MVAVAERPMSTVELREVLAPVPPAGQAARALARAYLRHVSALWRGDPAERALSTSLGMTWCPDLPPEPRRLPDAVSPHGAGGRGIRWFETGGAVLGYVPGVRGGYRVPLAAIPPARG